MPKQYDLVVIGAGTAARAAATKVRAAGRSVAIVDFRPYGGTCALRGCDPKKMLVGGAEALDHARHMQGKGMVGSVLFDYANRRPRRRQSDPGDAVQAFEQRLPRTVPRLDSQAITRTGSGFGTRSRRILSLV